MLFAYVSPGQNALNWLKEKAVDPVIEKTFEPEFLKTIEHVNNVFDIEWAQMFLQLIQIGTVGICAMAMLKVFGMKESGMMVMWLAIVECIATVMKAVMI